MEFPLFELLHQTPRLIRNPTCDIFGGSFREILNKFITQIFVTYLGASSAGYILNKFTDIFGTFVRLIVNLFGCFIIWLGYFF